MTHELPALFGAGVVYLLLLFLIAYATEQGKLPERWVNNPWVYTLSLGVYASSWSYYGSVGFAAEQGLLFLTIYIGVTFAFLLSPLLLRPILGLTREFAGVLNRPKRMPHAPGFIIGLLMGEFGATLLKGQRVLPKRLTDLGFTFQFSEIRPALEDLLKS